MSPSLTSNVDWVEVTPDRPPVPVDPTRFRSLPWSHQLEGIKALVRHRRFALFDEMGVGKSKQVVDAAGVLFEADDIDMVLLVCPAAVKGVWLDPEFGQLVQHAWVPLQPWHYRARTPNLPPRDPGRLTWVVSSYEFLRSQARRQCLARQLAGRRFWLVLDESIKIKNHRAEQTRACFQLRQLSSCVRVAILNGTPIANNLLDLYTQFTILDRGILGYHNFYHFRAVHGILGGYLGKQVVGFRKVEVIQRKTAPYVLRRLKKDCVDLPPKLYTRLEVSLQPETWRIYREMRDDMVAWVKEAEDHVVATQAASRLLRLAQITGGFVGQGEGKVLEVGQEKQALLLGWLTERWAGEPSFRLLVWCRFRAELDRLWSQFQQNYPGVTICQLRGDQPARERQRAVEEFRVPRDQPGVLLGQPQAGGFGLDFSGCSTAVYFSNDFSLLTRQQSEDRLHRPGQLFPVTYVDLLATGPTGQRTVDHATLKALLRKEDLATRTAAAWRSVVDEVCREEEV